MPLIRATVDHASDLAYFGFGPVRRRGIVRGWSVLCLTDTERIAHIYTNAFEKTNRHDR